MTDERLTHPHLEGLIPVAVEAFLASTGQAHTVSQLQRDLTTTCMRAALQAALAALPGGGVDDGWCGPMPCRCHDEAARRLCLHKHECSVAYALTSPTPNPHEADRNG